MKKKCIYNLYQWFIVILTIIAFMSFALGIILEQFQLSSKINLFVLDLHLIAKKRSKWRCQHQMKALI